MAFQKRRPALRASKINMICEEYCMEMDQISPL